MLDMGTIEAEIYCFGCLSHKNDKLTQPYGIQTDALKSVFQVDSLNLCYICKKIAQKSEQFIQNVQHNQTYLENFKSFPDSTILSSQHFPPLLSLSMVSIIDAIKLTNDNEDIDKPISIVYGSHNTDNVKVKLEVKEELSLEDLDGELLIEEHDFQDSSIKEEECLLEELKEENDPIIDDINLKLLSKTLKEGKFKKKTKRTYKNKRAKEIDNQVIEVIHLTREQCMKERFKMQEDPKFKNLNYKCVDCIKGFNFRDSFEKHMEQHSKAMGEYECDICKRRMNTIDKLLTHQKYHEIRYRCCECGLTRVSRFSIKEHYIAVHEHDPFQYRCTHCNKMFSRQVYLKKHLAYIHRSKKRVECNYCKKSFANKEGLKGHIMLKHPDELSGRSFNQHMCQKCGVSFKSPSHLKNHMIKHSDSRDFYCVECDKGFKSSYALKQHLKIASPHVNYLELKLQCEHCEKRFGIKRDLERHLNRIHLNRRPYQCDKCDKAYVSLWSLTEHKRFSHEGCKRPLKYPCPQCDKLFAQSSTLKSHILTHTGERPYACAECPAAFSQSSILRTHVKLVHLRLTRDGRPKKLAASS